MTDILGSGPTFEQRANAWGQAASDLETSLSVEILAKLKTMRNQLISGRVVSIKLSLATTTSDLIRDITARGAQALGNPNASYPSGLGQLETPSSRALADAALLRQINEPLCDQIADALEVRSGDEEINSYAVDVIISALLDVAANNEAPETDFAIVDSLLSVQEAVAFSPRSVVERTIITEVRESDTMQSISRRVYGDPNAWEQLITDYSLQPPYLVKEYRPSCFFPGLRLLRPGGSETAAGEDGLGVSFRLTTESVGGGQDWDLNVVEGGGFEMVGGLDALAVDSAVRLATPLGDLSDDLNYGYPELPGTNATAANALSAILAAETLMQDPRVADVIGSQSPTTNRERGRLVGKVLVIPKV